jgi:GNAT superfamily N-acetyltransferase
LGAGAVISASPSILPEVQALYEGAMRDDAFDPTRLAAVNDLLKGGGTRVYGPVPRLVCSADTVREAPAGRNVELTLERNPADLEPFEPDRWPNAFSPREHPERPLTAVVAATCRDQLVGVAATSADSEGLWQIGIDVDEAFRKKGIGAALTAALARHTLESGSIPFYGLAVANIPSLRTALAAGFVPAWVETFVGTPRTPARSD